MDYEKKYKEALELAKEILKTRCITGTNGAFYRKDIEEMFPELSESEDEKIRKWLIRDMQNCLEEGAYDGEDIAYAQKAIAWIEKQWEQKVIIPKFRVGDKVRLKGSCGWYNVTEIRGTEYYLTSNDVIPCLLPICEQDDWEVEQKHEWSEEDIAIIGRIRSIIEKYAFSQSAVDVNGELCEREYIELDNWLKSLKERYCPQSYWKPSDKQLDALHDAAVYVDKSMFPYPKGILMKMYKQLKKLREE